MKDNYISVVYIRVRCMCDLGMNVVISLLASTSVLLPSGTTWRSTDFARQDKTNTAQTKHIEHIDTNTCLYEAQVACIHTHMT